ncbi:MAG TPA: T9SS type A sorting domain-containing protein [Candidatus Eisenbacteria bacterium]|nr:T9SS type A sorting domain-containing protein [Candidatus Eisenbacteria bacterium]
MILIALCLAAVLVTPAPAAAASTNCWGVLSVTPWDQPPRPATLADTLADGLVVRAYWDSLETDQGAFRWSYLDQVFAAAGSKRIHLIVAPGFYSPPAVIAASHTASFLVPDGPLAGQLAPLPLPWDSTYLHHWFRFVDSLAVRYGHQPSLAYVSLAGPNAYNGEMALPTDSAGVTTWRAVAGSDTTLARLLEQAWRQTIDAYDAAFAGSGASFTIALVPNSLPLGDSTLQAHYEDDIIAYGLSHAPNRFGIQTNGLDGRPYCPEQPPKYHWPVIAQYSTVTLTGFQTMDPAELYACARRDSTLYQAVQNAIAYDAHFVEIYEQNVLDPSLAWVIAFAHQRLTNCGPAAVGEPPPGTLALRAAPNPSRAGTVIRYTLPSRANVDLGIYDLTGARVATLAQAQQSRGEHAIALQTRWPDGVYFCRLRVNGRVALQRLLIVH